LANKTFDYIHAGIPVVRPNFSEYQQLNKAYKYYNKIAFLLLLLSIEKKKKCAWSNSTKKN